MPPIAGTKKLNMGGACIEGVSAGCRGLVINEEGCLMGGFSKNAGSCSSYMAELWGLLEGLIFILDLGFRRAEVNTDSSEIVVEINQGRSRRSDRVELLRKIESLLDRFDEVVDLRTFREANQCVDALAKTGCRSNEDMHWFSTASSFIEQLLLEDILGGYTLREVSL
ncbi:unnamed protein product [Lathyrus sativus]|nr:unnamed protein product [Lathyrus sativus]